MLVLINLDSAIERRDRMLRQLCDAGANFESVGIDFRRSGHDAIRRWVDRHLPGHRFNLAVLSGAEVGCWASHLTAWRRCLEQSRDAACTVVEDDLILAGGFVPAIAALELQRAYDLVYLGTSSRNLSNRRKIRIGQFWMHEPVGVVYNTWGYTITRAYIERFFAANSQIIDIPIDHFLGGRARVAKPRTAVLRPAVVREDAVSGRQSQIEPHTRRFDRWRLVENLRRELLSSRLSDWYYRIYRLL
jgi:GR25 family glycosyltransferase involved in LPS biosynthesis